MTTGAGIPVRRRDGGPRWWCALPDLEDAVPAVTLLRTVGTVAARHQSGRSWLVTHPAAPPPQVLQLGARAVAVFGQTQHTPATLDTLLRIASGDGDLEPLMAMLGNADVVVTTDSGVRAVADATGFRRLFTARHEGVLVVASHSDVLRRLIDAPLDRAWIAAKLASPEIPSGIRDARSPFTGVDPVPAGHVVDVDVDGHHVRTRRWWRPPVPHLSLSEGADVLRVALASGVEDRLAAAGRVGVQLSGGLDSTALAFLAGSAKPLLVTTGGSSPADSDLRWARGVADVLPGVEHRIFTPEEFPGFFSDLDRVVPGMDEPCSFTAGGARQRHTAAFLAEQGVELLFNGQGGDEVLLAPAAYLASLPRTSSSTWRHVRGHAALRGITTPALLGALRRRTDYPGWLRQAPTGLRREAAVADDLVGWEAAPVLPAWASADAAHLVVGLLDQADPVPVHPDAGVHAAVVRIRASGYRAGLYRDAMESAGVPTSMPFFDHQVLTACLATRPEQRTDPWQPKPLLHHALRDLAPADVLSRRTKGFYNHDIYRGWKNNRDQVRDLLAGSRLAQLGLVDAGVLRRELAVFGPSGLPPGFVTDLVALEVWLRDLTPALRAGTRPCA